MVQDRLRSLEGTWAFRSLEVDGQSMPAAMLAQSRILMSGDRFRMESPEGNYEGILAIDIEAEPARIDIDFVAGPEAGNRCEGIFLFEGDELTICLGLAGAARPERFATAKGSGHALEVLGRIDRGRPAGVDGTKPTVKSDAASPVEPSHFAAELTPTLEKLQGEWVPLELVTSGSALQAAYLAYGYRAQMGTETKVVFGGQTMVHALVRVNEAARPVEIDYLSLMGKGKGSVSRGIFQWEGEEAVFCIGAAGAARPTEFTSQKGSGRTVSRWKRKS